MNIANIKKLLEDKGEVLIPALAAVIGSFLGFIGGIKTASIQGNKAIELEQKKFEFSIIQKVIDEGKTRENIADEFRFLVGIGVIEVLNSRRIANVDPEDIPSFRESDRYDLNLSESWGELHEAIAVWDVNSANQELEELKIGQYRDCVKKFAADIQIELGDAGASAFTIIPVIKKYYNDEFGCQLPMSGYYPPQPLLPANAIGSLEPLPTIVPYRQRNQ